MAQKKNKKSFVPKKKREDGVEFVKNILLEGKCLIETIDNEYAVLGREILEKSGEHNYPRWDYIDTKLTELDRETVGTARIELDSDGYIIRTKHGMYSYTWETGPSGFPTIHSNCYTLYYIEGDFE